ncbi:unnamed protein product [Ilex paraguariensis]|uniref:Uncharacterized protein n=1 Tax=Ilex paraguariensis TaxID=185542 RepID=A0ABC8V362_9AQUA
MARRQGRRVMLDDKHWQWSPQLGSPDIWYGQAQPGDHASDSVWARAQVGDVRCGPVDVGRARLGDSGWARS